jgi:3-phenylpropionate/trans-cinnamate dioxygenase ferredoxin subunit
MFNYREFPAEKLQYVAVASVGELQAGERILFEFEGLPLALFRVGDEYYAIADVCTHDDGPLAEGDVEGRQIVCPRHGARFDLATGAALTLPAAVDIAAYPVRVVDARIEVGIPRP